MPDSFLSDLHLLTHPHHNPVRKELLLTLIALRWETKAEKD